MSKQISLKICNDHLNYLVHLQQRQNGTSITKTLSSVINQRIESDPNWQQLSYSERVEANLSLYKLIDDKVQAD